MNKVVVNRNWQENVWQVQEFLRPAEQECLGRLLVGLATISRMQDVGLLVILVGGMANRRWFRVRSSDKRDIDLRVVPYYKGSMWTKGRRAWDLQKALQGLLGRVFGEDAVTQTAGVYHPASWKRDNWKGWRLAPKERREINLLFVSPPPEEHVPWLWRGYDASPIRFLTAPRLPDRRVFDLLVSTPASSSAEFFLDFENLFSSRGHRVIPLMDTEVIRNDEKAA